MSRWNPPVYNFADKLVVVAIVTVVIAGYNVATGAPPGPHLFVAAGVSAGVAGVIAFSLAGLKEESA